MRMSKRLIGIVREWLIFAGLILLAQLFLVAAYLALEPILMDMENEEVLLSVLGIGIAVVVILAVVIGLFWYRLGLAHSPRRYREASSLGIPAEAEVLTVERTRWRSGRSLNLHLQVRARRYEHVIQLRIHPLGAAPYEAETATFLLNEQVPKVGAKVPVKVHPSDPNVVVIDEDWLTWQGKPKEDKR